MTDLDPNQTIVPDSEEAATDQTHFGEEEPLFERTALPPAPASQQNGGQKPEPLLGQKKFVIGASIAVLLIMVLAIVSLSQPRHAIRQILQLETTPTPRPQQTALQARLDEVKTDLDTADPSKVDLAFPPIDKGIEIDQPVQQ